MSTSHYIKPEVFDAARARAQTLRSQAMADFWASLWRRVKPVLRRAPVLRREPARQPGVTC